MSANDETRRTARGEVSLSLPRQFNVGSVAMAVLTGLGGALGGAQFAEPSQKQIERLTAAHEAQLAKLVEQNQVLAARLDEMRGELRTLAVKFDNTNASDGRLERALEDHEQRLRALERKQ